MRHTRFPVPMTIKPSDEDSPRDIVTLNDASDALNDWAEARRGDFYRMARDAFDAGIEGISKPADAVHVLAAFCQHVSMVVR